MAPRVRTLVAFGPLAIGLAGLGAASALAAGIPAAALPLWRLLALQLCWIGLATATAHGLGGSLRDRLGLARPRLGLAPLAVGAAGLLALSAVGNFVLASLSLRDEGSLARLDALVEAARPVSPLLAFVATVAAPGLGEELLFRGLLQRSLAARVGAWAIPISAFAFGLLHQDAIHSPAAFLLGCYLGALAFFARSTWAAVVPHLLNNCAATLPQLFAWSPPAPTDGTQAVAWAIASAASLAFVAACARRTARPPSGGCVPGRNAARES